MRKLALTLGVATAIVGIWVMFQDGRPEDAPAGFEEGVPFGSSTAETMQSGGVPAAEESVEVADPGLARSEVEPIETGAGEGSPRLRILVVDKETGARVPGADVAYVSGANINEMTPREREEYLRFMRDLEKATHHYGTSVIADGEGVVFAPVSGQDRYMNVVGRREELYGQLRVMLDTVDQGDREVILELERDLTLTVQVLDSLGNPAIDVPIAIVPLGSEQHDFYGYAEVATTGAPSGLARIPHLQQRLRDRKRLGQDTTSYRVRPHIPGWLDLGELFDVEAPPADPIVFQLPATGRVIVETANIDTRETGYVYLTIAPDPSATGPDPSPLAGEMHRLPRTGPSRFEWVVAGKTYVASTTVRMESVKERFAGPVAEGHEVRVTLTPKNESYSLIGRILDERLEPVRDTRFRAPYEIGNGVRRARSFATDDEGRFVFTIGNEPVTLTTLGIQRGSAIEPSGQETGVYRMRGSLELSPGENDLGDVVLVASPVVASGTITVDGQAPEREQVTLRIQWLDQSGETEDWRSDFNLATTFPGDGRFEIRGISQSTRYRLLLGFGLGTGGRLDFLPFDPVEFVPGQQHLRVELQSGGSLQASVLAEESLREQNLWLRLESTDMVRDDPDADTLRSSGRLYGQHREVLEGRHIYRWGGLWSGVYRLAILPRGSTTPMVTVGGIQITAGEMTRDPRLEDIDLDGKFRPIKVEVRDENGRPMAASGIVGAMVLVDPSSEREVQGYAAIQGVATVIIAEPHVDLLVTAPGYQPRGLTGVGEDTVVSLEPYPEVVARIPGGAPRLPEGYALRVSLTEKGRPRDDRTLSAETSVGPQMDRHLHPPSTPQVIDDHGEVALQVGDEGAYTVAVSVRHTATRRTAAVRDVLPAEIQVRPTAGRQVFELQITQEALRQALAETGSR